MLNIDLSNPVVLGIVIYALVILSCPVALGIIKLAEFLSPKRYIVNKNMSFGELGAARNRVSHQIMLIPNVNGIGISRSRSGGMCVRVYAVIEDRYLERKLRKILREVPFEVEVIGEITAVQSAY